jgi:hypothetical protein
MERATRRWVTILVVVAVVYALMLLSHWLLGIAILPW